MDFLYRSVHMEQKKWETSTQMTIEEDMNVPDAKGDCLAILLKNAGLLVEETRVGRDQVVVKGSLNYRILYETGDGGRLEQLCGSIPFEEVIHVDGAAPGDLADTKGVIEDFKVSMINTRKIAVQSVVMLYVSMHQLVEEEWTDDVVNCQDVGKCCVNREILQLCQKKSDVFRVKEELELPGGYPPMQSLLWQHITLGSLETRPMDEKISLKGELDCFFIYSSQGTTPGIKMFSKKVPFHGMVACSGSQNDRILSVMPTLGQCTAEIKPDLDGEDRMIYLEAALELQLRIYCEEKIALLQDIYSTSQEIVPEEKPVHAPLLPIAAEGKCKVKQQHRLKEGTPKAVQILHTVGTVFPDREVWENGKLQLMGSVQFQILYLTGEEEMPYAVTECMVPYTLEMEGDPMQTDTAQKPTILVEPRLEQGDASLTDSEELELKGIVCFAVLVLNSEEQKCVGRAECKPLDTDKYAVLPGMVVCFADSDTPLWDFGKRYYMPVAEMKRLNNLTGDTLKAGERMLLVKGARE